MSIKAFLAEEWDSFVFSIDYQIKSEIVAQSKSYVLNVDEEECINYFYQKYSLTSLRIITESEVFSEPSIVQETNVDSRFGGSSERSVYKFTIKYNFEGTPFLFRLKPNRFTRTTYHIEVNGNQVMFSFNLAHRDPEEFKKLKSECYRNAFANIPNINQEVENFNKSLKGRITSIFNGIKEEYLKENSFFEAINLKVTPEEKQYFPFQRSKRKSFHNLRLKRVKSSLLHQVLVQKFI